MVYLVDSLEITSKNVVFYKPEDIDPRELKKLMLAYGWQSYIHNKRDAEIASKVLGINIEPNENTLKLNVDSIEDIEDTFIVWVFVGQFEGIIIPSFLITAPVILEG
ncbi:MAG: hypothetical protein RXO36_06105 [Candidatus Nanopusillus acidilobi]|jgi:hypothetical protein